MIYSPIIAIELFIFIFLFGPLSMLNLTIRYCSLLKFERLYAKFNFENVYSGCTQNGKIICKGTIVRVSILCTGCPKKTLLKEKLITSLKSVFWDNWYMSMTISNNCVFRTCIDGGSMLSVRMEE